MEEQPDLIVPPSNRASRRFSGEDLTRWAWTEPSVWTNPMLATLEHHSVRGGKWHSLIDKVYKPANLFSAYREVAANKGAPGVDHVTIEDFNQRYPNAYFAKLGLFSMTSAFACERQSCRK